MINDEHLEVERRKRVKLTKENLRACFKEEYKVELPDGKMVWKVIKLPSRNNFQTHLSEDNLEEDIEYIINEREIPVRSIKFLIDRQPGYAFYEFEISESIKDKVLFEFLSSMNDSKEIKRCLKPSEVLMKQFYIMRKFELLAESLEGFEFKKQD